MTGSLHMGHALNGTLQDVCVRVARMRGLRTKWIYGTDHAGIATQRVVERALEEEGLTKEDLGREGFAERVWRWREQYGSTITEQFKRLGASLDYEDERFTMDPEYVRAVTDVFVALHEKGYIYRDNYMVNWDPGLRTAISDLEVEQRTVEDTLYLIDYPLESGSGAVTVATVRPETMLADTAIAVNPSDERYSRLIGEAAILPLVGRRLPILADDYVDPEFGTGALKITPGHDPNDFEIGRRHGLEEVTVIGEDGRITDAAPEAFRGMEVDEARAAVVAALREEGLVSGHAAVRSTTCRTRTAPDGGSSRSSRSSGSATCPSWPSRRWRRPATGACASIPSGRGPRSTSTGSRTSGPGASRASSGGATSCRSGTAARRPTWAPSRPRARGGSATPTCSTPGSPPGSGRSRRSAGPRTRPSCAPSTPRTCSPRRATSSSSGWRGW